MFFFFLILLAHRNSVVSVARCLRHVSGDILTDILMKGAQKCFRICCTPATAQG